MTKRTTAPSSIASVPLNLKPSTVLARRPTVTSSGQCMASRGRAASREATGPRHEPEASPGGEASTGGADGLIHDAETSVRSVAIDRLTAEPA